MTEAAEERAAITAIVCGGRNYDDAAFLEGTLDVMQSMTGITRIRHGGATGADTLAGKWAHKRGVGIVKHMADWKTNGKRAGPLRNAAMLDAGANLVIAFPGDRGTADMIRQARARGVTVVDVRDLDEMIGERVAIQDEACRRYCAECGEYKREDDGAGDVRWVCFECWRKTE